MNTPSTRKHNCSFSWTGTDTSIKSGGVKLIKWAQISLLSEVMCSCKYFPHVSKMPTLIYNQANNAMILVEVSSAYKLYIFTSRALVRVKALLHS